MNVNELFENRKDFYIRSGGVYIGALASSLVGASLLAYGFSALEGRAVWGAYLFNLFFFFCLGLGGMAMAAIQDVVSAVWARPIKRIWEAFGVFLPVAFVMFLIFLAAVKFDLADARSVYSWIKDPAIVEHFWGKNMWLVEDFFYIRAVVILGLITAVALWQLKLSVGRDLRFVSGDKDGALAYGKEVKVKLNFWSGGVLIIYGISLTFFGMDMIMSLSPLWFSTLFGGWQFAVMMQTLFATTLIIMFSLKGSKIGSLIFRQQFHDVGKLMFGFTVFFAYTTFAHVLTYWYGNVPEETEYFIHRLHMPWQYLLWFVFACGFVIPMYSLVFKGSKWNWWAAIPIATMILCAQWSTNLLLVMPETQAILLDKDRIQASDKAASKADEELRRARSRAVTAQRSLQVAERKGDKDSINKALEGVKNAQVGVDAAAEKRRMTPNSAEIARSYLPLPLIGGFLMFFGLFFTAFLTFARRFPMIGLADPLLPDGIELSHHHHG